MTELLSCPFCGGSASVVFLDGDFDDFVGMCDNCFARGEATQWDYQESTKEAARLVAATLWNTRVKVDNANPT